MDVFLMILSGIFLLIGLIGCLLPVLPGTPLSYVGLLILQLMQEPPFSTRFMVIWALITLAVALLDYWIPAYGTKKFGGTKYGIYGTLVGLFVGLIFFPPFGIIIGPLLGALIGEFLAGSDQKKAVKAAFGSFLGFLAGTFIKLAASAVMIYFYFTAVL
ncbi:DUF456 domain-containing protein [Fulvivirga sedimenti]|uniref:DUF456 domain-containing protein n=1 Tax=Fulvivirga sedimenti TaxID=2879465 RepID=A0A9X1L2B4_9BACT|nr:DUF456 domain-containing protein [Fulvivirga sedimenti]MCA6077986.1 DUF456 domain-containing protein [Fulvivirga sedimenti]